MLVRAVYLKYHSMVPFPWTLQKIKLAGFVPKELFVAIGKELSECSDASSPALRKVIASINKLELKSSEKTQ